MTVTALQILQTVASETGLPIPTSIEGTQDSGVLQLVALLNSSGYEALFYYTWEQLTKKQLLSTINGVGSYPLPADWGYYIDQTQQNLSAKWPLSGPVSTQSWSYLENNLVGATNIVYQVRQGNLLLLPVPTAVVQLQLYYITNGWVSVTSAPGTYSDKVTKNDDVPLLDWLLLVKFVKVKLWESKGFDSTAFRQDFVNIWEALVGKDIGAPKLSTVGPWSNNQYGYANLPQASWPQ